MIHIGNMREHGRIVGYFEENVHHVNLTIVGAGLRPAFLYVGYRAGLRPAPTICHSSICAFCNDPEKSM